jgi:hypothetical protein
MGSRYLTDLAEVCRRTGWPVIEVDGWQSRARGSGGYDSGRPTHVMVHHTASGPSSDGWPDVNYCTHNDDDAPLCNLYLDRAGTVYVCAAGATNTNGSGHDPCGITNDDSMNSSAIGIEAGNDGKGEPWPEAQQNSYAALCAELCDAYGIGVGQVHGHAEWAPERKVDPAGPSRWAPQGGTWNMDAMRGDVAAGNPTPPPQEDDMTPQEHDVLIELHSALVNPQPGFTDPSGSGNLNAAWSALWGYELVQANVLPILVDLQRRLGDIEAKLS